MTATRGAGLVAVAALMLAFAIGGPSASGGVTCTRYASTSGNNSNPGTFGAPYRTVAHLLIKLRPGQTGCLRAGTFAENVAIGGGGSPGNPLILTSAPGERSTILGTLTIRSSANDVVVSDLVLNGRTSRHASPLVNGDRVVLRGNEITNEHTAICVLLGPGFESAAERALDPVVEGNSIHDCGRLPATGHDHGIYVEGTNNARIVNNVIYDNADYGIHLYPDADGTYVANNVVDGNGGGLIFAGERSGGEYAQSHSSDNNVVENNIFSNSTRRNNIESWWGGPTGSGNLARLNCVWNGLPRNIDASGGGFSHSGSTIADPLYINRAGKDYRLRETSRCAGKGPGLRPDVGPAVRIFTRTAKATARGFVAIRIARSASARPPVSGRLSLRTAVPTRALGSDRRNRRSTRVRLGSSRFVLGRVKARAVRIKLSAQGMKALRRLRRLRVRASVVARDAAGASRTTSATIVVTAPRRARRR